MQRARLLGLGVGWTAASVSLGWWMGKTHDPKQIPPGYPRACCEPALSPAQEALPTQLGRIVGDSNVQRAVTQRGARLGRGEALAVVKPGTIAEAIEALQACVDAGVCVVPQGANTSLTGGSVPRPHAEGRPQVVINMRRLATIQPIDDGERFVCLAGAGIYDLSQRAAAVGRESHSVLGSIFLNPSVAAGISFGSGGTQIRKGPVYTERLLYAAVTEEGKVTLVNSLGLHPTGEELYGKLEGATLQQSDVHQDCALKSSCDHYSTEICRVDASVSRWNADTRGPAPNRCEGKLLILASVHDSFPLPKEPELIWVSTRDFETAQAFKYDVCLSDVTAVPTSCEYMNKDTIEVVDSAGRVLCQTLRWFGIGSALKTMWDAKTTFEGFPLPYADSMIDKLLFTINDAFPASLPGPVLESIQQDYSHHMLVGFGEFGHGERHKFVSKLQQFQSEHDVRVHSCSPSEASQVTFFRFAAAPAFRTWCVGHGAEGVSVDYVLPKNSGAVPSLQSEGLLKRMRYSHFGCNVVHEDVAYSGSAPLEEYKGALKKTVEGLGGKLPAEHGHGTEYMAPEATRKRWEEMDPLNVFNPGVGGLSMAPSYKGGDEH